MDDLEGIVQIALPLAIAANTLSLFKQDYPYPVIGVYVVSNILIVCAVVRALYDVDVTPFIRRADDANLALVISSRTLVFVCTTYMISTSRHLTVVRTYAYCTLMYIAQLLAIMHVRELVSLLGTYSVDETTRVKCVVPESSPTGFIFDDTPFVDTCPTRVWEHARINILFASQLYVLYTLTTDIDYDLAIERGGRNAAYAIGILAVIECTAVGVATCAQFDVIAGCHQLSWGVGGMLLTAAVAYGVRRLYCLEDPPWKGITPFRAIRGPGTNQLKELRLKL